MKSNSVFRIRLISGITIIVAVVFVGKLYSLQIIKGDEYRQSAERQYLRPANNFFNRGSIFFTNRDKNLVGAAILKTGFSIIVNPKQIQNIDDAYNKIGGIIALDKKIFTEQASKKNTSYSIVAKKIDELSANQISDLKITGVSVYKDKYRYYPSKSLASNVIGIIGYKGDILAGRYGLESYYEDTLSRDSTELYGNFFAEIFSTIKKKVNSKSEGDIITSIEPATQAFLEKQLIEIQNKWHSKASGAVIMDPNNGEIFAMASYPTFDPNSFQNEKDVAVFSNPIIEHVFEMGSILKPITMASGLDSGAVTAESTYTDSGFLILNGSRISNFDGKARGVANMQTVLNDSLNTGAAYVASKMGKELFSDYFRKFGLGEETGIDMPNETPGLIDNLKSPRDIEHATASFGQGIAMSPINMVRALSALGNGGYLVTPHIVKQIDYKIGLSKKLSYEKGIQVIKPETSKEISRMLVNVVDKALLGGIVKMPNYNIAAKTGTAQIAKEGGGGYYTDKYLHSFFGYFPAYNPKFIVFFYTLEPKGVGGDFASHTLTAPFIETTKFLISYYKIPPDR